jgi:hypothetical protein
LFARRTIAQILLALKPPERCSVIHAVTAGLSEATRSSTLLRVSSRVPGAKK